jgi:pimeloyl-ACP methyl ester carboxylesterase
MMPSLKYDDAFEALVDDAARMAPQAAVGHFRALDAWNIQSQLGRLDQPALILCGQQDILIPCDALERTARGLRRGRLVTWPDVGHSPQLEQPDRFARLLLNFVGERQAMALPGSGWLRALWRRLRPGPAPQ